MINKNIKNSELLEVSDSYLVSLVDNGFIVNVRKLIVLSEVEIYKPSDKPIGIFCNKIWFNYNEIKDDLIPFITILNIDYDIFSIGIESRSSMLSTSGVEYINVEDIIEDKLDDFSLSRLYLQVSKKRNNE